MKKRILTAALTVALSLTTVCSAKAATTIDVHYNNWDMPITGYLKDGTTYVPIRQFFQLLGGSWVPWNSAELSANVRGNANAAFYLGSRTAWIDSEKHQLPGRSYSQDGIFYVATGTSTEGSTAVQNWTTINEERIIFPLEGRDSSEGNAFANFQSEVENFFPDLSGITGQAHYIDDKMETLTINIMTQFFGETEMVAFTQYLKQSAATYLPVDLDVEIVVESSQSIEAFLKKDRTASEYFAHVFN